MGVVAPVVAIARLKTTDAPCQLGIDLAAGLGLKQRVDLAANHHPLVQRHRAMIRDNNRGVAAHGGKPLAELLRVGHCGGQADDGDTLVEIQDDLFPHCAARGIGEEVDFIHDHVA